MSSAQKGFLFNYKTDGTILEEVFVKMPSEKVLKEKEAIVAVDRRGDQECGYCCFRRRKRPDGGKGYRAQSRTAEGGSQL